VTLAETRLNLEVPVDPHYGHEVRRQVLAFAAWHSIEAERLTDFLTALGEALANAFEHSGARTVVVEIRLTPTHILAQISDEGVGFPSEEARRRLPEPSAERGRGIPLMRSCCDIFELLSQPGSGTSVVVGCTLVQARR
jgi:anti-sigma regulatory factor (Ser/Thr protein kinase)